MADSDDCPILMVAVGISDQGVKDQVARKQITGAGNAIDVDLIISQRGRRFFNNKPRNPVSVKNAPDALHGVLGDFIILVLWIKRIDNIGQ